MMSENLSVTRGCGGSVARYDPGAFKTVPEKTA